MFNFKRMYDIIRKWFVVMFLYVFVWIFLEFFVDLRFLWIDIKFGLCC